MQVLSKKGRAQTGEKEEIYQVVIGGGGLTMLLHHAQELHDNLRRRSNKDLSLPRLLCVVDGVQAVIEY